MSKILDKGGVFDGAPNSEPFVLELGCGDRKRIPNSIGIDALDYAGVDLVGDVFEVLRKFPSGSVGEVYAYHFIEHLSDITLLLAELARVVRLGGTLEFVTPHFSNPYFYSDPTHRTPFGLYTFCYLAAGSPFSRQVPTYQADFLFRIERVDLVFKSARPFYGRYAFKWAIGRIFNSCNYMREWYEENLCYLFPCYEICYRLRRVPT